MRGGGRAPPTLTSQGQFYPHHWMYVRKQQLQLCVLCGSTALTICYAAQHNLFMYSYSDITCPLPKSLNFRKFFFKARLSLWRDSVMRFFAYGFFSWINFPPAPEYPIWTVSNFFKNSRVKVHHQYQWHQRQILPPISLVLLIPEANNGSNIRLLRP